MEDIRKAFVTGGALTDKYTLRSSLKYDDSLLHRRGPNRYVTGVIGIHVMIVYVADGALAGPSRASLMI